MGERFGAIFRTAASYMTITRVDNGAIVDISDSFLAVLGRKRDEVLGKRTIDLGVWADPADRDAVIDELRRNGSFRNREIRLLVKGGEQRTCLYSGSPLEFDGVPCMLAEGIDVTDLRMAEEALKAKMAEIGQLNRLMMGREQRVIELKREVNELLGAAGEPPRYSV